MATEEVTAVLVDTEDDQQISSLKSSEATSVIIMDPCIYRVPPLLRKMNEEACTPSLVSIGPFHHQNQTLKPMQDLKFSYYNKFLERTPPQNSLDVYAEAVTEWEDKIRHCYYWSIPMASFEFVSMILTDGCFIIELFVSVFLSATGESNEDTNLLMERWPRSDIMRDLILLENQIPFFVLQGLFNLAFPSRLNGNSFLELAYKNFQYTFLTCIYPPNSKMFEKFSHNYFNDHHLTLPNGDRLQVEHLCDMLRAF
ncbi:UPF0481 protein At3g47200-like [Prosopis cineraria]|uniref:UPF0481 protein At3g47200-like n=1 Tax=Prosopis cineraria TaxID=364024 RepID=UPI00240F02BF|nr:UPF0481 protein At3g47200-like [Prosopis cineraria]